jgi:hypothetical protein
MRTLIVVALFALTACRGEPVPRDYQNAPPDLTNAPQSKTDTPSAGGMGQPAPQPSTGVEGQAGAQGQVDPSTGTAPTTLPDTPPTQTTT